MPTVLKCPPFPAHSNNFQKSSNSLWKLALKLRVCVRFAAIFNVKLVAVLTMTWSYVRTTMIYYCISNSINHIHVRRQTIVSVVANAVSKPVLIIGVV